MKDEYKKLKFKLPSFESIDKDFDISDIEHTEYLLKKILEKISEKLKNISDLLESALQPDTTLSNLYEYKSTDQDDKNKAFALYKRIMKNMRRCQHTILLNDEEKNAKFLVDFMDEWPKLNSQTIELLKKLEYGWERSKITKEDISYLG